MSQENWSENEFSSNFVKFNKVGDYIQGTLLDKYKPEKPDVYGKTDPKYAIRATEGKWHAPDGEEFDAIPGEVYRVGSKPAIEGQMKNSVMGQKIRFKLTELRKSKMGNPAKIITVFSAKDAEGRPILDSEFTSTNNDINPEDIPM